MKILFYILLLWPLIIKANPLLEEADLSRVIEQRRSSRMLVFKNIYVFRTDAEKDRMLGNMMYDFLLKKLVLLRRFSIYEDTRLSSELLKTGLTNVDIGKKEELYQMSDSLALHGFIEPVVRRNDGKLDLILRLLEKDGKPFTEESAGDFRYKDNQSLRETVFDLTDRLVARIPYSGLITGIENELFLLDVGKKDGFKKNDVVRVFEIVDIKRHPVLGFVVDIKKETVGRLMLVEANECDSVAKVRALKPGKDFLVNMKIDKEPIPKDPFLYPEPVRTFKPADRKSRYRSSLGTFEARIALAMFRHVFSSENAEYNQTVSAMPYPEIHLLGDLWLTSRWIVGLSIHGGVVPVKDSGLSPSSINGIVSGISLAGKYRIIIGESLTDPQLIPAFGVFTGSFYPDRTEPLKLTKKTYYGILFGGELQIPIDRKFFLTATGLVYPFSRVKESPRESGSKTSSLGYYFDAGLRYLLRKNIELTGGLRVRYFGIDFSGESERNTPNARSSMSSIGMFGGTKISF